MRRKTNIMRKGTAEKGNGIREGDGGERIKNRPIYMLEERYIYI